MPTYYRLIYVVCHNVSAGVWVCMHAYHDKKKCNLQTVYGYLIDVLQCTGFNVHF